MRDLRVGAVQVPGAQYDPRRRRARIFTSMDVTVTFRRAGGWLPKRVRTAQEEPFGRVYRSVAGELRDRGARAGLGGGSTRRQTCGEEYLIVTSPTLRPAADTLAASKTAAGFAVGIHEVAPNTAAADVRTFIRGELNSTTCTRPTYVVLLGDTSHVPSFLEVCPGIDDLPGHERPVVLARTGSAPTRSPT